jgi:hypothetical protein
MAYDKMSCKSCLSSFKVSFIQYKHGNGSVTLMRYLSMDKSLTKNCSGSSRNSSQVMYGIHFEIIGIRIRRNIMPENETEEECEASDKDDWQTNMPDGDAIDDVEEASVDDDSPPPRNRQRLSC